MSQVGLKARSIREERGESQEAVARRADITTATYSRIENGHNEPSLETLRRIAGALDVSIDELVGGPIKAA
jgi:transcriptional regulator with XRE-family HTH domain